GDLARHPGFLVADRVDARHDVLGRLRFVAPAEPAQRRRRGEQLQKPAAVDALEFFRGRKLAESGGEIVRVFTVFGEAAPPIGPGHRWHTEQLVSSAAPWIWYWLNSASPDGVAAVRVQPIANSASRGRKFGRGSRWQATHHPIRRLAPFSVSGMVSIRPWQVSQPTPLATWIEWLK